MSPDHPAEPPPVRSGTIGVRELTPEQKDKLRKSASRLIGRHGWWAFAQALAEACQEGANCWHTYPESAALWQRRADIVRALAERNSNPPPA